MIHNIVSYFVKDDLKNNKCPSEESVKSRLGKLSSLTFTHYAPPHTHVLLLCLPPHTHVLLLCPHTHLLQLLPLLTRRCNCYTPPLTHTVQAGESEEDNEDAAKLAKHRSQEYDATLSTPQQLQIQELRSQTESPCYLYDLRLQLFYARYLCVPLLPTICLNFTIDSVPLRPLSKWYY